MCRKLRGFAPWIKYIYSSASWGIRCFRLSFPCQWWFYSYSLWSFSQLSTATEVATLGIRFTNSSHAVVSKRKIPLETPWLPAFRPLWMTIAKPWQLYDLVIAWRSSVVLIGPPRLFTGAPHGAATGNLGPLAQGFRKFFCIEKSQIMDRKLIYLGKGFGRSQRYFEWR